MHAFSALDVATGSSYKWWAYMIQIQLIACALTDIYSVLLAPGLRGGVHLQWWL
jgi:hypothetical protein